MDWNQRIVGACPGYDPTPSSMLNHSQVSSSRASTSRSLYYCLFVPHIYGCCSLRTFHSWWTVHSAQRQRRGCHVTISTSCVWLKVKCTLIGWFCCNLYGGVALIVWFTMNGMCVKNKNIYMWHEQAITEWFRWVISIVACCHSAKPCAHAAQDFRSQQFRLSCLPHSITILNKKNAQTDKHVLHISGPTLL